MSQDKLGAPAKRSASWILWLLLDLFLVVLVGVVAIVMFVWWGLATITYDEPLFDPSELSELRDTANVMEVPLTAHELPEGHRLTAQDIQPVELSWDDVKDLGDLTLIMMMPEQIKGRVLRRAKPESAPFLTTDFYLEGTEPGAEPGPSHTSDPPWPARRDLRLLADEFAQPSDASPWSTLLLPAVAAELPAGRVVRQSDVSLRSATREHLRQESLPSFEVLMSSEQIIGRQLCREKRLGDPFLLSDFAVDGELEVYLRQWLPNFVSRRPPVATDANEVATVEPWPAPAPLPPTPSSLTDDPESLFGPLPDDARHASGSRLGQLLADEQIVLQLALRSWPLVPATPGVLDLRDVVGNPLAAREAYVSAGPLFTKELPTWFGGATLRGDTEDYSGQGHNGAINTFSQNTTNGDYVLAMSVDEIDEVSAGVSDESNAWWLKVEGFGGFSFEPTELPGSDEFAPAPSGEFDIFP